MHAENRGPKVCATPKESGGLEKVRESQQRMGQKVKMKSNDGMQGIAQVPGAGKKQVL